MSDLLHWYARIHGPRAFRIMQSARSGELDLEHERADAASAAQDGMPGSHILAPPPRARRPDAGGAFIGDPLHRDR